MSKKTKGSLPVRQSDYSIEAVEGTGQRISVHSVNLPPPTKRFVAGVTSVLPQSGSMLLLFGQRIVSRLTGVVAIQLEPDMFRSFHETLVPSFRQSCERLRGQYGEIERSSLELTDDDLRTVSADRIITYAATIGVIYVAQGASLDWYQVSNETFRALTHPASPARVTPPDPLVQIHCNIPVFQHFMSLMDVAAQSLCQAEE